MPLLPGASPGVMEVQALSVAPPFCATSCACFSPKATVCGLIDGRSPLPGPVLPLTPYDVGHVWLPKMAPGVRQPKSVGAGR